MSSFRFLVVQFWRLAVLAQLQPHEIARGERSFQQRLQVAL